ncbi:glycosyltransferase family 4 protein [Paenibacillus sp. NPDC101420]|uniref:glycosyltransferase family 4 protein n=1 Tax=Paenibacillus sp. NPDC101420 TaxID=3390602 RepID=UPI003D021BD5
MRIAYFSPFNPLKSGISDYSEYLVTALSDKAEVDLWVSGFVPINLEDKFLIMDYIDNPGLLEKLPEYDAIIYNIGNNPYYHSHIYDIFLKYNGYVILHDLILYYLVTGFYLELINNSEMLIKEAYYNGGFDAKELMESILRNDVPALQYKNPENLPLNKRLIENAKGILVHSEYAKKQILTVDEKASCWVIPQIGPQDNEELSVDETIHLRNKYNIGENDLIIASFGFVAESKRIHQVLHALSNMNTKGLKYLLVGEGDYINPLVKKYKLESIVIQTGFTTIEEFDKLIKLTDIVVNLRYPYMGETSASMIRALLFGKPSIVTDIGWFSELPDESIVKVGYGENEVSELKKELEVLIYDKSLREKYSKEASRYAMNYLNRSGIINNILNGISDTEMVNARRNFKLQYCDRVSEKLIEIGLDAADQNHLNYIAEQIFRIL